MSAIGTVSKQLDLSPDTLRYYEKIGLLKRVYRNAGGTRRYSGKDISRLKFIKRAQQMGFSLAEIGELLSFRENPQRAKPKVRQLAHNKLADIEKHLLDITTLKNELTLLVNLCTADADGCPILEGLDQDKTTE
jgi:MerR family transcriptional regulator, copper efflux regulator